MNKLMSILAASVVAAGTLASVGRAHSAPPHQFFTVRVMPGKMGLLGPDGLHHDSIEPSTFVLRKGVPVTLRVINYDDAFHSIAAPGLGLIVMIKPGIDMKKGEKAEAGNEVNEPRPEAGVKPTISTITFTPTKRGQFRWNCAITCDGGKTKNWSMSAGVGGSGQLGYMAGYFTVL